MGEERIRGLKERRRRGKRDNECLPFDSRTHKQMEKTLTGKKPGIAMQPRRYEIITKKRGEMIESEILIQTDQIPRHNCCIVLRQLWWEMGKAAPLKMIKSEATCFISAVNLN